ncbi:hypothetical protein V8F20_006007 [Naviculisporaceae sp. PSN 640]
MMIRGVITLCLLGLSTVPALANDPIDEWKFTNAATKDEVAKAGAPDWNFDKDEKCFPSAAIWDGKQSGAGLKNCAPKTAANDIHPWAFPTYYRIQRCDYTDSRTGQPFREYHVMYNVFFAYSTNSIGGHDYDWEWAILKWKKGNNGQYIRRSIVLEAHGKTKEWAWDKYPNTNEWTKNGNRPIIKFGWDGHGLEADIRNNKKWFNGRDWVSNTEGVNFSQYNWGKANSNPDTFAPWGSHDLCYVA